MERGSIILLLFLFCVSLSSAQNNFDVMIQVAQIGPGPTLTLTSPENIDYSTNQNLLLNFSVNNQDYLWYNLDGGNNIIINSSALFNTTFGQHILYLTATNSEGNTSRNVTFNVIQQSSGGGSSGGGGGGGGGSGGGGGGGGSGGGGGGGGSIICQPTWSCSEWSNAAQQCGTRTCTDSNNCNNLTDKPEEITACPVRGVAPQNDYCGDGVCSEDEGTNICDNDCSIIDDLRIEAGVIFWIVFTTMTTSAIAVLFFIVRRIMYVQSLKELANS